MVDPKIYMIAAAVILIIGIVIGIALANLFD